ncbi:hypothetical protein Poli38472_006594 [Pythium oligandrum]|uniref:WRKY19-like zinc finger domain-containing protein n=1 Tax=Pythium oligandrum TaxID=41045 RepID=A0A8K1C523_PYTOL|nr:hypothetical protein Poli38472_006594 [Pythium oligandrum]|eukprot:TMW56584.1 hypothetical protein Poli38472_006594 [Pythium oligandrum]
MPLRKFELLSLMGRKNKQTEEAAPPSSSTPSSVHHRSNSGFQPGSSGRVSGSYQSSGSSYSSSYRSSSSSTSLPPPPAPSSSGFYPSVQYERLTPSSSGARGTVEPHVPAPQVQYERLVPSGSSAPSPHHLPSPPVHFERLSISGSTHTSPAGGATLAHRSPVPFHQNSPLQYDAARPIPPLNQGPPRSLPSPPLQTLSSPVDLAPLRPDVRRSKPPRPGSSLAPVAENAPTPDVEMDSAGAGTPSDKSTPFSLVMEEWMSQLRTPTPDVMLLPSPFDFNKGTPTPVEKMEDLRHIHEALLPTPPPDQHDQRQEDIASLCRDLISREVSNQLAKRLASVEPPKPYPARVRSTGDDVSVSNGDLDDDDDRDGEGGGSTKGKRRKMCTAEGCQNLSRSRGLCKAHGGGRRCSVDGCTRASQSGSLCITHGGGKRCTVDGCQKAAQSRGMCKAHGGGVRCRVDGCAKSSQGDGFCRTHGGGRRCGHPSGCTKWAQRNGMCMAHSEGKYGNSYRGRIARMTDDEQHNAAAVLASAAHAPV